MDLLLNETSFCLIFKLILCSFLSSNNWMERLPTCGGTLRGAQSSGQASPSQGTPAPCRQGSSPTVGNYYFAFHGYPSSIGFIQGVSEANKRLRRLNTYLGEGMLWNGRIVYGLRVKFRKCSLFHGEHLHKRPPTPSFVDMPVTLAVWFRIYTYM